MRNGRRIITRVIVFLLLGAIVNVAVAWAPLFRLSEVSPVPKCSHAWQVGDQVGTVLDAHFDQWLPVDCQFATIRSGRIEREGESTSRVFFTSGDTWVTTVAAEGICSNGPDWYELARPDKVVSVERWRAGWPFRSFEGFEEIGPAKQPELIEPSPSTRQYLIKVVDSSRIPVLPMWPAFAINTLFYAAILWLLFAAPFALRRRRRIKRGLCPACAYPVGASEVCTECGKPVQP